MEKSVPSEYMKERYLRFSIYLWYINIHKERTPREVCLVQDLAFLHRRKFEPLKIGQTTLPDLTWVHFMSVRYKSNQIVVMQIMQLKQKMSFDK